MRSVDVKLLIDQPPPAWTEEHMRAQHAEIERLRRELDDLKSVNARLRGLISNKDAEIEQLWAELWQEVDERNKIRADNVQLRERLKGSDMLAHVRGEQIERLQAALAYYADPENDVSIDSGAVARRALEEVKG